MATQVRTFRIFVSSTFSDLIEERNALQEVVFPLLRELCQAHGTRFQAIDLRWGVSEEASLDQQTMNICLGEIARCQQVTPRPNFIILLGERYGWRPPPPQIPADEFEALLKYITNLQDNKLLQEWYWRDDNAVPPEYCLQPRQRGGAYEEYEAWAPIESRMVAVLERAAREVGLDEGQRLKYTASATHQEITNGALQVEDAHEHVFCFFREIEGLPQDGRAAGYLDLAESGGVDQQSHDKLLHLKGELRQQLPGNVNDYRATWMGGGITTDHLEALCQDVYDRLAGVILAEIAQMETIDPLEAEIDAHTSFGHDRARHFVGRKKVLKAIDDYLNGDNTQPLVIWGVSGSGKSALMAKAVQQAQARYPEAHLIYRFIGATPDSSDGRALLEGLCRQIHAVFDFDEMRRQRIAQVEEEKVAAHLQRRLVLISEEKAILEMKQQIEEEYTIPLDYQGLATTFQRFLTMIPEKGHLTLFLDALDQLSDIDNARSLVWLPVGSSGNVKLVVSTLSGECKAALESKLPERCFLMLESLPAVDAEQLLDVWLADSKRTLQEIQRQEILDKYTGSPQPLYLKLAFEQARHWKSYSPPDETTLQRDIPGMIRYQFGRLSLEINHGRMLISRSMGYLAAARNGLSEDELVDVLSLDEQVIADFLRRSPKSPVVNHLPVVVWSRLYFDLEPYLTYRAADGASLLGFYHRQVGEVVEEAYLSRDLKVARHKALAGYFAAQTLEVEQDDQKFHNLRKLSELPYQQAHGELRENVQNTLTDFYFLQAKVDVFGPQALMSDYDIANEAGFSSQSLKLVQEALRLSASIIAIDPCQTAGQLTGRLLPFELPLIKSLLNQMRGWDRIWLRPLNPCFTPPGGALMRTLVGHDSAIHGLAIIPNSQRIISASRDKTLKIWDLDTGSELATLSGHTAGVLDVEVTPDGRRVVSASDDNTLKIWNLDTATELLTLSGYKWDINKVKITPEGRQAVSVSDWKMLRVWDLDSGKEMVTLKGHSDKVLGVAVTPDGHRAISASQDRTLKVWDLRTGEGELDTLRGHTGAVNSVAVTPDGHRVISASQDGTLKVWNLDTEWEVQLANFTGHTAQVNSIVVTPDGSKMISASRDKLIKVWDLELGVEVATFRGHNSWVNRVVLTPDGQFVVSASSDKRLKVWDLDGNVKFTLRGHTGPVVDVAVSSDGYRAVSVSRDNTILVWDLKTGSQLSTIEAPADDVIQVAVLPDGHRVIYVLKDRSMKIWDLDTGTLQRILKDPILSTHRNIDPWIVTHDGRWLIYTINYSLRDYSIRVLNLTTGDLIPPFRLQGSATGLAVSSKDRWVVSANEDGLLRLLDIWTKEVMLTFSGHKHCKTMALTPDNCRLITADASGILKVWDLEKAIRKQPLELSGHTSGVLDVALTPNGRRVISCSQDGTLKIWDLESGEELGTFYGHTDWVKQVVVAADGSSVASASLDGTIKVWDLDRVTGDPSEFSERTEPIYRLTTTSDGHRVVFSSTGNMLKIWDFEKVEEIGTLQGHSRPIDSITITPDGRWAVSASGDKTLKIWDLNTCQEMVSIDDDKKVLAVALNPNTKHWVSMHEDGILSVCNHSYKISKEPQAIRKSMYRASNRKCHEGKVSAAFISPNSLRTASVSDDGIIKVWDVSRGLLATLKGHERRVTALAITPDNCFVISGSFDGTIRVWYLGIEECLFMLKGHNAGINSIAVTPNGRWAVSTSKNEIKYWDLEKRAELFTFIGEVGLSTCAISPDGLTIIAGGPRGRFILRLEGGEQNDLSTSDIQQAAGLDHVLKLNLEQQLLDGCISLEWKENALNYLDLGKQGNTLVEYGNYDEALDIYHQQGNILRKHNEIAEKINVLGERATNSEKAGDLDGAMAQYIEQESICREVCHLTGLHDALQNQALILQGQGKIKDALALYEEQAQLYSNIGDLHAMQRVLVAQATILKELGDLEVALERYQAEGDICRKIGDSEKLSASLANQADIKAMISRAQGDLKDALSLYQEQEQIFNASGNQGGLQAALTNQARILRKLGDLQGIQIVLGKLAMILIEQNDLDEALALLRDRANICRQLADQEGLQWSLGNQAMILKNNGDLEGALQMFQEQALILREIDHKIGLQSSLHKQGLILKDLNELDRAVVIFKEEEKVCREINNFEGLRFSLDYQAQILRKQGDLDGALALYQEIESECRNREDLSGISLSLMNQASVQMALGNIQAGLALFQESGRFPRFRHPRLGQEISPWANKLEKQGILEGALELYRLHESCFQNWSAFDHERREKLASLDRQAVILTKLGDLKGTLAVYKRQQGIHEHILKKLGDLRGKLAAKEPHQWIHECKKNESGITISLRNQAQVIKAILAEQGDIEEKLALYQDQVRIYRSLLKIYQQQRNVLRKHNEVKEKTGLQYALGNVGIILHRQGDLDAALDYYKEQEQICRENNYLDGLEISLGNQAIILKELGELDAALSLLDEKEQICRGLENNAGLQWCLGIKALICEESGDFEIALNLYTEQGQVCQKLGDKDSLQISQGKRALILHNRGDLDEAMELYKMQELTCRELNNRKWLQFSLGNQALILMGRGDLNAALSLLEEKEQICRKLGNNDGIQWSLGYQASIRCEFGDLENALELYEEMRCIARDIGNKDAVQTALVKQAWILWELGNLDGAMEVYKELEIFYLEADDMVGLQFSIGNQGVIFHNRGDLDDAFARYKEQERICREINHPVGLSKSLENQISILQAKDDLAGAKVLMEELEQIQRQINDEDNS